MDHYTPVLREFFRLLGQLWLERLAAELQFFAEALDTWLHALFLHPTPAWRESFEQFLAEQEAAGRIVAPESRRELEDFLEGWWKTVDSAKGNQATLARPDVVEEALKNVGRRATSPSAPFRRSVQFENLRKRLADREFFFDKIQEAKDQLDQMERVLIALGQKLDAAQVGEEVEVESDVDAIEVLIWRYNDALEKARDAWLRHDLGSVAFDQLTLILTPAKFNLPLFTDLRQAERAKAQQKQIDTRLDTEINRLDRVILGMQIAEAAGTVASLALGGGVVFKAVQQGGKWAVVKTVARVATSGAAAHVAGQAVEHGLRAAGVSEETIHGVSLAAELVTWLLLLRRVRAAGVKPPRTETPKPAPPNAEAEPASVTSTTTTRPGSVSDNPANRLVETGVPLKGRPGWQKRWTRMTREDELRQAEAIAKRYNEVIREADHLPDDIRKQYVFEQMRRFRTEYRESFLRTRKY